MLEVIVTLACLDRAGIVAEVAGFLARRGFTIRDSQQVARERAVVDPPKS